MPAKRSEQFVVNLPSGPLALPAAPVDIPADSLFFWPFNLDLGHGVRLRYATAEPICQSTTRAAARSSSLKRPASSRNSPWPASRRSERVAPGRGVAFEVPGTDGRLGPCRRPERRRFTWPLEGPVRRARPRVSHPRGTGAGRRRGAPDLERSGPSLRVGIFPAPARVPGCGGRRYLHPLHAGPAACRPCFTARSARSGPPVPPARFPLGKYRSRSRLSRATSDFTAAAAVWRIKLPRGPGHGERSDPAHPLCGRRGEVHAQRPAAG